MKRPYCTYTQRALRRQLDTQTRFYALASTQLHCRCHGSRWWDRVRFCSSVIPNGGAARNVERTRESERYEEDLGPKDEGRKAILTQRLPLADILGFPGRIRAILGQFSMFALLPLIHYEWKQGSDLNFSLETREFSAFFFLSTRLPFHSCLPFNPFFPHLSQLTSLIQIPHRAPFLCVSSCGMWAPLDVSLHTYKHVHTLLFLRHQRGGTIWGSFVIIISSCWIEEEEEWRRRQSFPSLSVSVSLPGGLYGWKWGVLSASSLSQTVPAALSEDQPEGRAADNHRHGGSVPQREAARSPRLPHGELQPVFALAKCAGGDAPTIAFM